jgi:hypothetical protein
MANNQDEFVQYVEKKYPGLVIDRKSIGIVLSSQTHIALGKLEDAEYIVIAEMTKPKHSLLIPIDATLAYWSGRHILWRYPRSIHHAIVCANEHGVYREAAKEEKE